MEDLMKKFSLFFLGILLIFIAGCATRVRMEVTKPAEVNLAGVKTLSVLDFEYTGDKESVTLEKLLDEALKEIFADTGTALTKEEKTAQYATNKMVQTLADTQYFTIVDAGDFKDSMDEMTGRVQFFDVLSGVYDVDAVMIGTITNLKTEETYEIRTRTEVNPDTGVEEEIQEQWVTRRAELEFEYKILDTENSRLMVQKVFNKSTSDSELSANYNSLTSEEQMYRSMIDSIIKTVSRQLVPYTVTESRSLMKDKTKNPKMEVADEYVKVTKYQEALEIFLEVWKNSKNIAAGYNAAIMYEAMGDLDNAISQMDEVLDMYPDKKVFRELERLKAAKEEREKAMAQMEGRS